MKINKHKLSSNNNILKSKNLLYGLSMIEEKKQKIKKEVKEEPKQEIKEEPKQFKKMDIKEKIDYLETNKLSIKDEIDLLDDDEDF